MSSAGQTRHLRALADIYRFSGGLSSPEDVDIERPITVVHDVAAAAAQSSVIYTASSALVVTGGAGVSAFTTLTRANVINELPQELRVGLSSRDLWLLGWNSFVTSATAGNFALVAAGVVVDDDGPLVEANQRMFLGRADATSVVFANGGEVPLVESTGADRIITPRAIPRLPVKCVQLELAARDDGVAGITVRHVGFFALAPTGVVPA